MTSLWMPSNDVMCIHPGDEPVLGHQAVARSWRSLFRSGDSRFSTSVIKVSPHLLLGRIAVASMFDALLQCCLIPAVAVDSYSRR